MIRLLIDGCVCEMGISHDIRMDYHSTELEDISAGREGRHIILNLPSTPQNDTILGNAFDPASIERFNAEYHKAVIEVDGVEIFRGTAYLDAVEIDGEATMYRVEIVGGAKRWVKQAERLMFNRINIDYRTRLDMDTIQKSWSDDSPVKFLPVQRELYEPHNGTTSLYVPEKILSLGDYQPFISVRSLVYAILDDAGYQVESRFLDGELARSLYVSGAYPTVDVGAKIGRMDFLAGRFESVTAMANAVGRVYATPAAAANSVGNIVNSVASEMVDDKGNVITTGLYSLNNCFEIADDGFIQFRPTVAADVGFEYNLKFACDYRMKSRQWLKSFDSVHLENRISFPLRLSNRFRDYRDNLRADFRYRIVIFDYSENYEYRVRYFVNNEWHTWADISSQSEILTSTAEIASAEQLSLQRIAVGSTRYTKAPEDWAIYEGSVNFEGSIEAELTLRTPAVEVTPTSPKRFNSIYFDGGEEGMSLTILPGTTLRPIFTSAIGYGSALTFEDVAHLNERQSVILDAIRRMFNLRFYTDEALKIVYIEPYDDFIRHDEQFYWSGNIDHSEPIVIEELASSLHERRTLAYRDEDATVRRYNAENDAEFGAWSFDIPSRASIEGEQRLLNPLFAPTISVASRFVSAESALVMQIYDDGGEDITTAFTPRIVRFVGMAPLAEGEQWSSPYGGSGYPLAAFHYAGGDEGENFTLCFEDRDGCVGLHSFYDGQFAEEAELRRVSLAMYIPPEKFDNLFHFVEGEASIRSTFILNIRGVEQPYRLDAIEEYNPSTGIARCRFAGILRRDE